MKGSFILLGIPSPNCGNMGSPWLEGSFRLPAIFGPVCRHLIWSRPTDNTDHQVIITSNSQLFGWKNKFLRSSEKTDLCALHFLVFLKVCGHKDVCAVLSTDGNETGKG